MAFTVLKSLKKGLLILSLLCMNLISRGCLYFNLEVLFIWLNTNDLNTVELSSSLSCDRLITDYGYLFVEIQVYFYVFPADKTRIIEVMIAVKRGKNIL